MERIQLKALNETYASLDGQTVVVAGWARTIRDSKAFGFIELNDGSCFKNTQIVFERATLDNYDEIAKQNVGCALVVKGVLVVTPENKQPYEIKATCIEVEGASTPDYPLQKKRHTIEFCVKLPTFALEPTSLVRCSVSVVKRQLPFTNSSMIEALFTCIPPF